MKMECQKGIKVTKMKVLFRDIQTSKDNKSAEL